ncbi:hypothetical protein [Fibrobacter sp. UWB1]|uniref:hypothetical protein n=1 Tax=Fibrobacter sp. UWB1 TaxID=1964355 RepID=UPI0011409200|nr:hypothetical protein [Fibrobacter sp. UWB1]
MPYNGGIRIVLYKKIVAGDIRKFRAESNDASTGGGARDLRFSPANKFFPILKRMFPNEGVAGHVYTGELHWRLTPTTHVTIHAPTESRPNEVRIAKVHECFPRDVVPNDATDCILILLLDENFEVWAYFTSEHSLRTQGWHQSIKSGVLRGLGARRSSSVTPAGYLDFENGDEYTNES